MGNGCPCGNFENCIRQLKKKILLSEHSNVRVKNIPHILFLGNQGAGKSTLFYSIFLNDWKPEDLSLLQPTRAFHYEVVKKKTKSFGMLEASGSPCMQQFWSFYYKSIRFAVIFFVVSVLEKNFNESKEWIRRLVTDDYLRHTIIFVIINHYGDTTDDLSNSTQTVVIQLSLHELKMYTGDSKRFQWCSVNAKNGIRDKNWSNILQTLLFDGNF